MLSLNISPLLAKCQTKSQGNLLEKIKEESYSDGIPDNPGRSRLPSGISGGTYGEVAENSPARISGVTSTGCPGNLYELLEEFTN